MQVGGLTAVIKLPLGVNECVNAQGILPPCALYYRDKHPVHHNPDQDKGDE